FFSSRRRHTRLQGDWSSDVCSSDLSLWWAAITPQLAHELLYCRVLDVMDWAMCGATRSRGDAWLRGALCTLSLLAHHCPGEVARSEERRVGKECRTWRSRTREKMKR